MTRRTNRVALRAMIGILIATFTVGCSINRRYANTQIHQLPHTSVSIEYACEQNRGSGIQQSDSTAEKSVRQLLTINYPHPSPKYGQKYAEVTLRRESDATDAAVTNAISQLVTNPFKNQAASDAENDSAQHLTIPREELEFLLRDLVADSFFDREDRTGDVHLSVTLGSRNIRKPWDRVSSFDQLAQKVIEENGRRSPSRQTGKIQPASAELLPPSSIDPLDDASPDSAPASKPHRVPNF